MVAVAVAVALIAAAGCARPGNTPVGTPTAPPAERHASVVAVNPAVSAPEQPSLAPSRSLAVRPGVARCALPVVAVPKPGTTAGAGADEAQERARRALESQRATFPVRAEVPAAAVPGAIECARLLQLELTLRRPLDEANVQAALTSTGLTKAVVEPGPRFATSTGLACIVGTVTGDEAAMVITPLPADRTCRP
jgi:hypothetical protein